MTKPIPNFRITCPRDAFRSLPNVQTEKSKGYDPYEQNKGSIYDSEFAERKRDMWN